MFPSFNKSQHANARFSGKIVPALVAPKPVVAPKPYVAPVPHAVAVPTFAPVPPVEVEPIQVDEAGSNAGFFQAIKLGQAEDETDEPVIQLDVSFM